LLGVVYLYTSLANESTIPDQPRYNWISQVLDKFDISQIELAAILEVTRDTVSRWCNNKHQPTLKDLAEIAQFFGISMCSLVQPPDWSKEPGPAPVDGFKEERAKRKAKAKIKAKKKAAPKKSSR
jgi:putative transcriptional regulator